MPPPIVRSSTNPTGPWKLSLDVSYIGVDRPAAQTLQFDIKLFSTDAMCELGGTFTIVHQTVRGTKTARRKLFSIVLPKQPSAQAISMRNYGFAATATVDLTLGKVFELEWSKRDSGGLVQRQASVAYPADNVHA
jgi:hypothetical protein